MPSLATYFYPHTSVAIDHEIFPPATDSRSYLRKYWAVFKFIILVNHLGGGGRVVRRCWVNFQCRGVLLIWIIVGQGPIALAVGAGGGCLDIFSLIYHFSFLSPSLWETARYRLKYCLKGPLSPKQPTNHLGGLNLSRNSVTRLTDCPVNQQCTYM